MSEYISGKNAINQHFEGSQFHHLHINSNNTLGLYIPKELHLSIKHNHNSKRNMDKINKEALLWLCSQEVITGDHFDPTVPLNIQIPNPIIKLSEPVKEELDKRKEEGEHSSYDSLIRELLGMNKRKRRKGD